MSQPHKLISVIGIGAIHVASAVLACVGVVFCALLVLLLLLTHIPTFARVAWRWLNGRYP